MGDAPGPGGPIEQEPRLGGAPDPGAGPSAPDVAPVDLGPPPAEPEAEVMGVLEDDRIRAVVTTSRQRTVVTLEGDLDGDVAPVVDELLDAVDRWHTRAARIAERSEPPTLLLDARRVDCADAAGWRMLEAHRERWERRRGPCLTWRPAAQGSSR